MATTATEIRSEKRRQWQSEYDRQRWPKRKERLRERRRAMLLELGGRCVDCGEDDLDKLEFDHKFRREWKSAEKSWYTRLEIYAREMVFDLIECRCSTCNKRRGQPPIPGIDDSF